MPIGGAGSYDGGQHHHQQHHQQPPPQQPPRRQHAQDAMVLPTVAARAMLGGSARGGNGIVPVGRDVPIGLNIERFLGPANPFGQDPFRKKKAAPMDETELISTLVGPSDSMGRVLSARLSHLRVVGALWGSSGPAKAMQHALDMDDDAVLVDVLNGAQPKLERHVAVDLAIDLTPSVHRLVESEYEDYILCGLTAATSILKAVGPVLRDTAEAARHAQGGPFRQGVDVHLEDRMERCEQLCEALGAMGARVDELAGTKGRAGQLATRVAKSLARAIGEPAAT